MKTLLSYRIYGCLLACLALLLADTCVVAQEARDFTFSHIGQEEGMCSQRIYSIRQTGDGAVAYVHHRPVGMFPFDAIAKIDAYETTMVSLFFFNFIKPNKKNDKKSVCLFGCGAKYVYLCNVGQDFHFLRFAPLRLVKFLTWHHPWQFVAA